MLDVDSAERERIVREVAVSETSFFRYPDSYDLLIQHLQSLRQRQPSGRLRMLSIACASGEEPYSMGVAAVYSGWPAERVEVIGVDRSEKTLQAARRGQYPLRQRHQPIPAWSQAWLREEGGQLTVDPSIIRTVRFLQADAITAPTSLLPGRYAVVFCRNLLIYLHIEARNQLVDKLDEWLEPDGLLFVGHAEKLDVLRSRFQAIACPGAFALWRSASAADPTAIQMDAPKPVRFRRPASRENVPPGPEPGVTRPLRVVPRPLQTEDKEVLPQTAAYEEDTSLEQARRLADLGRLDEASALLQAAMQAGRPSAELYHLLGSVQLALGCLPEARDAFRRAVYLEPDHEESLLQLSIVYQRLGDDSHAARYRKLAARAHRSRNEEKGE